MNLVLAHYPVRVAGRELTLYDIEHRILRPIWKDARIHYLLNCAAGTSLLCRRTSGRGT